MGPLDPWKRTAVKRFAEPSTMRFMGTELLWPVQLAEVDLETDEKVAAYFAPFNELERMIATTPAQTVVGLSIKARLVWENENDQIGQTPWTPLEDLSETRGLPGTALYSVTADGVRLALAEADDATEGEPDPVVSLVAEWKERWAEYSPYRHAPGGTPECEKGEELITRVTDVEDRLLATTPTTTEGVALYWQFLETHLGLAGDAFPPYLRTLRSALGRLGVRCLDGVRDDVKFIHEVWGGCTS